MANQPNFEWNSDEMIKNANNWSLAGDVALLNRLKRFSENVLSESLSISNNVNNLLNDLDNVSLKLDLTRNEFQRLRNTQFVENRVYEDDETLESNENKIEEKEPTDEEKEKAIRESILTGLKVMDKYFDKVEVTVSDSEDEENEKSYVLQPKDPYADRPLPYLVGSEDWYKKWHVGLLHSESESESEKEEEIFSSGDSEDDLPKERILGSETSSELDFTNRNAGPVANSTFNDSQDRRSGIFHSSDESSEQSSSFPVKTPLSNQSFAEQLAARLDNVISDSAPANDNNVNKNPIKKMSQTSKYGNFFSDEPPPLDDLDDTILPKSAHEGLFSVGKDLFADDNDDGLFWEPKNKPSQNKTNSEDTKLPVPQEQAGPIKSKVSTGLFDNSDSSSEEDMFSVAEKRKITSNKPFLQPFKPIMPLIDDQPPEITPQVEQSISKKKPIGGVSIFGENSNIFSNNPIKASPEDKTPQNQPDPKTVSKTLKKTSLFDSSDEEITPKIKSEDIKEPEPVKQVERAKKPVKKLSLFDDDEEEDDEFVLPKTKDPAFKNNISSKNLPDEGTNKNINLLKPANEENNEKSKEIKNPGKKISLFDNDDDFLKEEEDIFSTAIKRKTLFEGLDEKPQKSTPKGLFENEERDIGEKSISKKNTRGLFDDLESSTSSENISKTNIIDEQPVIVKPKIDEENEKEEKLKSELLEKEKPLKPGAKGLFDDLEDSWSSRDLFAPSKHQNDEETKVQSSKKTLSKDLFDNKKEAVVGGLFEDLESSGSTESLFDSKKINKKFLLDAAKNQKEIVDISEAKDTSSNEKKISEMKEKSISKKSTRSLFDDLEVSSSSENIPKTSKGDEKPIIIKPKIDQDIQGHQIEPNKETEIHDKDSAKEVRIKNEDNVKSLQILSKEVDDKLDDTGSQPQKENILNKVKKSAGLFDSDDEEQSVEKDNFGFKDKDSGKSSPNSKVVTSKESKEELTNKEVQSDLNDWKEAHNAKIEDLDKLKPIESEIKATASESSVLSSENKDMPKEKPAIMTRKSIIIAEELKKTNDFNEESKEKNITDTIAPVNFTIPPPLNLFDPTPPPDIGWDDESDNSEESDTFSLSDGLLDRTNFNQSGARSSLFDNEPPSLDVGDINYSSGIVRDINVTRVETDDSSFYPHASSSRRLSSDIYSEQQSQDSFFVTKSRVESVPQGASLGKIPENVEQSSSKIDNITPSGTLDDFEDSSVFEKSQNESKEKIEKQLAENQVSINAKTEVTSNKEPLKSSEKTTSPPPGKIKHNLKINVGALLPGAAPPKSRTLVKSLSSDETDKAATLHSPPVVLASPTISGIPKSASEIILGKSVTAASQDGHFGNLGGQTEVLLSVTKDRARIPVKRRPSTRRARQAAVSKSMTDFGLYQDKADDDHLEEQSQYLQKANRKKGVDSDVLCNVSDLTNSKPVKKQLYEELQEEMDKPVGIPITFDSEIAENPQVKEITTKISVSDQEDELFKLASKKENIESSTSTTKENKLSIQEQIHKELQEDIAKPVSKEENTKSSPDSKENKLKKQEQANEELYQDLAKPVGISLVFEETLPEKSSVKPLKTEKTTFDDSYDQEDELFNPVRKKEDIKSVSSLVKENEPTLKNKPNILDELSHEETDIFQGVEKPLEKPLPSIDKTRKVKGGFLFDDDASSDDEDLFSNASKSSKTVPDSSKSILKNVTTVKETKTSLFTEQTDSESDSELFGIKPKVVAVPEKKKLAETLKKPSLFEDSDESSEDDLFGAKGRSRSKMEKEDLNDEGSILNSKSLDFRNTKIANIKKLENKKVDFDPLSDLPE